MHLNKMNKTQPSIVHR